jgi:mevalonate kinase
MLHYSAPVGVIISGEEGLLYGRPAFGSAMNVRAEGTLRLKAQGLKSSCRYHDVVLDQVLKSTKKRDTSFLNHELNITLPIGLDADFEGVIAAEIVVTTALLYKHIMGKPAPQDTISNIAFQAHKKISPRTSGLYTSLSAFGGLIYYRKEFEFLKGIYKLPYKIPENIEKELYIDLSEKPDVYNISSKKADLVLSEQEKRTKRAMVAIIKEDKKLFFDQFPPMDKKNYRFSQSFDGVIKK